MGHGMGHEVGHELGHEMGLQHAMCLIVTRPRAQAQPWVEALVAAGWQAQALSLIEIQPLPDSHALARAWLDVWHDIPRVKLLMFVSANAVEHFFAARPVQSPWPLRPSQPAPLAWPPSTWAGSTGPGTTAALLACGVPAGQLIEPAADAPQWDTEALWLQMQHRLPDWAGQVVWVVRGEDGRDWLADKLRAQGAEVRFVAAYRRAAPEWGLAERALVEQALTRPQEHLWLFSSSEALANLAAVWPRADWSRSQALASHPRIAQAAVALGFAQVSLVRGGPPEVSEWLLHAKAN